MSPRVKTLRAWGRVSASQQGLTRGLATTWGLGKDVTGERKQEMRCWCEDEEEGKAKSERHVQTLCDGGMSTSSSQFKCGPGKDSAGRGNNNRQIAKIYTYIPIHDRIHKLEEPPDSLSSNGERVTGTVTAPNSKKPHHHGERRRAPICPYLSKTPPSGSQRSASWRVQLSPPPTCPRWTAHSCWRRDERRPQTPHSCSTWRNRRQMFKWYQRGTFCSMRLKDVWRASSAAQK